MYFSLITPSSFCIPKNQNRIFRLQCYMLIYTCGAVAVYAYLSLNVNVYIIIPENDMSLVTNEIIIQITY